GGLNSATVDFKAQLGRVTSLRSEPANAALTASRLVVNDQSGTVYFLNKTAKTFTPYLHFADIFPKFVSDAGNTAGIVSIVFDPDYARNGKFYTVHVEKPDMKGSALPRNSQAPTLDLNAYPI